MTDPARPDDLRAEGWRVAVHNDYRQHGEWCTFWIMTRRGVAVRGEGPTDREALDRIREQIAARPHMRVLDIDPRSIPFDGTVSEWQTIPADPEQ